MMAVVLQFVILLCSSLSISTHVTAHTFNFSVQHSLLAFLVGEFDAVSQRTPHTGVMVTVYTPPGKSASGSFALQAACKSLEAYNDFFATPYPLPKLDLVAIPAFAAGAMGMWFSPSSLASLSLKYCLQRYTKSFLTPLAFV